jgi:RNA polymerase sigma factor FliA
MPDADELWERWSASHDDDARDALVRHYWPLVRSAASGVKHPRHLGADEMESHASLGLLDALDRYDPSKGPFEPYARARMRGAVVDGIREHDRASRTNLGRAKALDGALEDLTTRLHRTPTDAELAGRLGVPETKLRAFHHARLATTVGTLDIEAGDLHHTGSDGAPVDSSGDGDWAAGMAFAQAGSHDVAIEVEHRLRQATLAKALDQIDGPDRAVLVLYYVTEMTMAEIGDVLGVATARVSQIHTRAVRALKANLQPTLPTLEEDP